MKNEVTAQLWRDRIAACKVSGFTVTEYCRQNNVQKKSYYYWKRRLAITAAVSSSADSSKDTAADWLSVETSSSRSISEALPLQSTLVVRVSGAEIEVGADFNPVLLRAVVSALGPQSC